MGKEGKEGWKRQEGVEEGRGGGKRAWRGGRGRKEKVEGVERGKVRKEGRNRRRG